MTRAKFVPRVSVHESMSDISASSFHVLSSSTLGYLKHKARTKTFTEQDLMPLMMAVDVNLVRFFVMEPRKSKILTR